LRRWLLLVGLACLVAGTAHTQPIILEAEDFTASHDEGGAVIQWVTCTAASGGKAVEGLDYPGDWIELTLVIWNGSFCDSIRSAGLTDSASTLTSLVFGAGPAGGDLTSVYSTYGLGIG
jgi:hypothetical protein